MIVLSPPNQFDLSLGHFLLDTDNQLLLGIKWLVSELLLTFLQFDFAFDCRVWALNTYFFDVVDIGWVVSEKEAVSELSEGVDLGMEVRF